MPDLNLNIIFQKDKVMEKKKIESIKTSTLEPPPSQKYALTPTMKCFLHKQEN